LRLAAMPRKSRANARLGPRPGQSPAPRKRAAKKISKLFVVRWKKGSFPAAFKNIITAVVIIVAVLVLLKEILDINVTSLIATTTVLTATIGLAFQSRL